MQTACGKIIEFRDDELERRQDVAAREHGFMIKSHSLKLFGLCRECCEAGAAEESGEA